MTMSRKKRYTPLEIPTVKQQSTVPVHWYSSLTPILPYSKERRQKISENAKRVQKTGRIMEQLGARCAQNVRVCIRCFDRYYIKCYANFNMRKQAI